MIFGKKNQLVGLDIGSRTIKVAEAVETKSGWAVRKFGSIDIAPGLIEEGVIKDGPAVAEAIRELFHLYNIRQHNVAISIGGYSVIVKNITVQQMPEDQLYDSLHFEAEQYIPFDINDVNLDFQVLGENEQNPNQMNVLLVAAKKEMVNDYVNIIDMAGLNLCIIDIDAFALQNIYELNYTSGGENIALIDIGAGKTSLNILKDNVSVFMRDVSLGCNQINHKIVSMANCSMAEAEDLKLAENPDKITTGDLEEAVSSVVSDWCNEIRRALDFFYSTNPEDQIKHIMLSGGGANIKQFRDLLAVQTAAEVRSINPFEVFEVKNSHLDPAYLQQIAPQVAICMGLAIRRVDDK
ncbi:MAG: pilus assembly protein PilM [Desulfobacteraceae bacterium]|nr:pilus assembly protein PilM [Desulfobacteraceae bacterium]MCF8094541.1 pilus assembly protein PilM [Desulfobacteraceae bacterium]